MSSTESTNAAFAITKESELHTTLQEMEPHGLIQVQGYVKTPGEYPFDSKADLFSYIDKAGGITVDVHSCDLVIVRHQGQEQCSLVFRLDQNEKLPPVEDGDILILRQLDGVSAPPSYARKPYIEPPNVPQNEREPISNRQVSLSNKAQTVKSALEEYIHHPHFKRILNQIASNQATTGIKSIAVLSQDPGEGKSFFTAALALGYARFLDSQVLILDTNNQPKTQSPFLELVHGDYSFDVPDMTQHPESTFVDLVSVNDIGQQYHPNTDFYVGPYTQSLKDKYDIVLVDTCALSTTTHHSVDPVVVANQVDAAILVVSPSTLERTSITQLGLDFKRYGIRLMGIVANQKFAKW